MIHWIKNKIGQRGILRPRRGFFWPLAGAIGPLAKTAIVVAAGSSTLADLITNELAANLAGFWKMDEDGTSGSFADSSGNGITLTASGTITYQQSSLVGTNKAVSFATGYGYATSSALGSTPGAFTMSLLRTRGTGGDAAPISCGYSASSTPCISFRRANGTSVAALIRNDAGTTNYNASISYTADSTTTFAYEVITWDGTAYRHYMDGSLMAGSTVTAGLGTTTLDRTSVGSLYRASAGLTDNFKCQYAAMWKRALSADEISDLYDMAQLGV